MRLKSLLAAVLCTLMVLSLTACGGGEVVPVDETKQVPTNVLDGSKTHVDNEEDAGNVITPIDNIGGDVNHPEDNASSDDDDDDDDDYTSIDPADAGDLGPTGSLEDRDDDDDDDDYGDYDDDYGDDDDEGGEFSVVTPGGTVSGSGNNSNTVDRPGNNSSSSGTTSYRFQNYVVKGAEKDNFVFSGEAIMYAVDMWSEMVGDSEHKSIDRYLGRDYLGYEDRTSFQLLNRIWVDDPYDTGKGAGRLVDKFFSLPMDDKDATKDKNEWVSNKTGGYIESTPSEFTDKTYVDLMVVPFMKDTWKAGTLSYDIKARAFKNLDGTETRTRMFWDEGLTYWDMGNAKAYCMYLDDGNYVMFILPDDGVRFSDIKVSDLMSGQIESSKAHVAFYAPSFTTESTHTLTLGNFGLPIGRIASNVISDLPRTFEPTLTQQSKISISAYGVGPSDEDAGNAGEATPPTAENFNDELDFVRIVLNRPFMYYIGDAWNEDIAFMGIVNQLPADQAIRLD